MMDTVKSDAPSGAQSIHRTAAVLRALAAHAGPGMRLSDVMTMTGLQRPTAHRMLQALILEGLARQDAETKRYRLGPALFELGLAAAPRFDIRGICGPSLDRLAAATEDTAFLTVRSGYDSVCLDRREGSYPIRVLTVEIGGRRPLGTTAGSLALLCDLDARECEEVIAFNAARLTEYARLKADGLRALAERGRTLGYALNDNDFTPGITGLGVSLPPAPGRQPIALSVVALSGRLAEPRRSKIVAMLKTEARKIAAEFGGGATP